MNNELQPWTDDLIYKHALTFSHEELAGMYSLCNEREQGYLKEIKALRLILQSHGEVIEMNAELKFELVGITDRLRIKEEENARLREALEFYADKNNWEEVENEVGLIKVAITRIDEQAMPNGTFRVLEVTGELSELYDVVGGKRAREALERGK